MTAKINLSTTNLESESLQVRPEETQRILVVDDEPSFRRLNRAALLKKGYHVDTAADGQAGWEQIQAAHYDLVITDNNMPKMTGLELIEKMHVNNLTLPVILVTAEYPVALQGEKASLRIEATLLKPYTLEQFLTVVGNVLYSNALDDSEFQSRHHRKI